MSDVANDSTVPRRSGPGVLYGLSSSAAFGLSGPLAKGLIDAGWTAGSAVTARLLLAAAEWGRGCRIRPFSSPAEH
jgi:hypothetical protein